MVLFPHILYHPTVYVIMFALSSNLHMNSGQRVHSSHVRARTSSTSQDGVNGSRAQNAIMGETPRAEGTLGFISLKAEQCLRQMGDLVVTASGLCLCVFWTTLLYHLLWHKAAQWAESRRRSPQTQQAVQAHCERDELELCAWDTFVFQRFVAHSNLWERRDKCCLIRGMIMLLHISHCCVCEEK